MNKVELQDGYVFYGWAKYLPDEIVVVFSYSKEPIEKDAAFGFMWQAQVDGQSIGDKMLALSDNPFLTEKEKSEMFETVESRAYAALDEILADKHKKAGIPQ